MGYWHSRGLRGSYLEECINQTNKIYLEQGLAVVQKLPTAIKPIELDPGKGTIKLAYFEEKSTVDYMGNVQGIPICYDAKETTRNGFPSPIFTSIKSSLWMPLTGRRACLFSSFGLNYLMNTTYCPMRL